MTLLGAYIPGTTLLHRLDSSVKLISFIIIFVSVLLSASLLSYALSIALIIILYRAGRVPLRPLLRGIRRFSAFFLTVFLMNAFFQPSDDPVFSWWIVVFSRRGVMMGLSMVFHVLLALALSSVLTAVSTPIAVTDGLRTVLHPLSFLGIPVDEASSIISLAISFIPLLAAEGEEIMTAARARGASPGGSSLRERAYSLIPLAVPLFLSAFRRAEAAGDAMTARGYQGTGGRTRRIRIRMGKDEVKALLFSLAVLSISLIIKGAGL